MKFIMPCLASFLLTAAIMPFVIRLATACNCLDAPGGRRLHKKITPRWGGAAFFAGVLPFLFIENSGGALTAYIVASSLLAGVGMVDDLKSLGWKIKFAVMAAAATIVIFGGDISVHQIGVYGSLGLVELGWLSIPFTFISIIGITNAINLLDGLDGLAGGVSLLGFLFMGFAALSAGNVMIAVICFAFVGALAAFLFYNFPNARIFMGDTGSLFLGFSLAITAVLLTQDAKSPVDTMFPVLVLLIPIFDTLRVLLVRLLKGKNPFKADHLHLHFLFVQRDISPVNTTLIFWSLTAVLGGIALSLTSGNSMTYLNIVLFASVLLSIIASGLTQVWQPRKEERTATQNRPVSMNTVSAEFNRHGTVSPSFGHERGFMAVKMMVIIGILLLAVQALPEDTSKLKSEQNRPGDQSVPADKANLSKRNQARIEQAKAAKLRRENSKSKLSKRNQARIKQSEAAKTRNELIGKSKSESTK